MFWKLPVCLLCPQGAVLGSRTLTFPTICFPAITSAPQWLPRSSSQTLSSAFSVMVAAVACALVWGKMTNQGYTESSSCRELPVTQSEAQLLSACLG